MPEKKNLKERLSVTVNCMMCGLQEIPQDLLLLSSLIPVMPKMQFEIWMGPGYVEHL